MQLSWNPAVNLVLSTETSIVERHLTQTHDYFLLLLLLVIPIYMGKLTINYNIRHYLVNIFEARLVVVTCDNS